MRTRARRGAWLLALAALLTGTAIIAVGLTGTDRSDLERAMSIVRDDGGFDSSAEAATSFARAAELLHETARRCHQGDQESGACVASTEAFALAQTAAVEAWDCAPAGVSDLRRALLDFLAGVVAVESGGPAPAVPRLPRC